MMIWVLLIDYAQRRLTIDISRIDSLSVDVTIVEAVNDMSTE